MRYPRAYLLFDSHNEPLNEEFLQNISGTKRKIYLQGGSRVKSKIENSINNVRQADIYLNPNFSCREVLVISSFSIVDFISMFFSEKNMRVYWLDSDANELKLAKYINSLIYLESMRDSLRDAISSYNKSRNLFKATSGLELHDPERYIIDSWALGYCEIKTSVESEILVTLKSLLAYGILNRIDLDFS